MYQRPNLSSNEYPTLGELAANGVPIFNDWWDTYIHDYRPVLEQKIIRAYYFEEIGVETPQRFVFELNAHLERIMPYYNQLYKSELIKIDPLVNHSVETNGRSIENLIKKANTTDDKFAKAIRDFSGMSDKSGAQDSTATSTTDSTRHDTGHDEYEKSGLEHMDDVTDTTGKEDETTNASKDVTGNKTTNDTEHINKNDTSDGTKNEEEKPNETSEKTMQWGATEKGTEKMTGKDVSEGSGTRNWTETKDDDANTDTTTHLEETSSSSGEKDYADTPQKKLDVTPELGTSNVRKDYLTNVTWTDDSSKHESDTTQNVKFTDDETVTHDEDTTDNKTVDKTTDTETSKEKGGTDTETTTKTGTNVTDTTTHDTLVSDSDRTLNGNVDTTENTKENEVRDLDTKTTTTEERDKNWSENGHSDNTFDSSTNTIGKNLANTQTTGHEQSRELSNLSQSSVNTQNKTAEETTDEGSTTITKGFMNVSSSALLETFRKTFINIDQMIIEELRNNFMLIY